MDKNSSKESKKNKLTEGQKEILITIIIVLICVIVGIYLGRLLFQLMYGQL